MKRNKQIEEAIKRLKLLDIFPQAIREFEKEQLLNKSEHGGILYWLDDEEQQMVKDFEEKHGAVVYHIILDHTRFGTLYSLLYVSQYEEEWDYDLDELEDNRIFCYVVNKEDDCCSEFGSIGIKKQFGGLVRTC